MCYHQTMPMTRFCFYLVLEYYNLCLVYTFFSAEIVEDVDLLIRRAERCLEAGADMIMIDADDVCKYAESLRSDIIAKIIGRLGLEKTMFEASNKKTSEWFVKRYGPRVQLYLPNLFNVV